MYHSSPAWEMAAPHGWRSLLNSAPPRLGQGVQDAGEPRRGRHSDEAGSRARGRARAIAFGVPRGARGGLIDLPGIAGRFAEALGAALALEVAERRFFLFLPVVFAAGIALYFGAPREPWPYAGLIPAVGLAALTLLARERPLAFHLLALLATLAAGFATASLQVQRIAHPVLQRAVDGVEIAGFVEAAEQRARGSRITLALTRFDGRGETAPRRVRVTLTSRTPPEVGAHVALRASLAPPPGPAYPGGFDFGRLAWLEGIGATGFALGKVAVVPATAPPPAGLSVSAWLAATRATIADRIRAALLPPGASAQTQGDAAIAVALVTGLRDGVPESIEESMRVAGLSHVLSISGLHMALVATGMFFLVRALLALSPALALRYPIKNWAAVPAALAATFYLVLSGGEVATQRAYLMTLIVLAGVALGRPALTLRTLAVAALLLLALTPWAVLDPGAQMSFAATLALVAAYAHWGRQVAELPGARLGCLHRPAVYIAALVLTSLAAGLATAPFAAYHFQRLAPLSLIANLGAMPIASFIIMPAGLAGALLIPFGWDAPAWHVMGWGIGRMVDISRAVAAVPGADRGLPALPLASLVLFALALTALCLLRSRLVLVAPVLALAGLALAPLRERPDILVDREGRTVAVRQSDGRLTLMGDRDRGLAGRFVVEQWLSAEGERTRLADPTLTQAARCDPLGCTLQTAGGEIIALSRHRDSLEEDCRRVALLITTEAPPKDCAAQVLRIDPRRQTSALALYREAVGPEPAVRVGLTGFADAEDGITDDEDGGGGGAVGAAVEGGAEMTAPAAAPSAAGRVAQAPAPSEVGRAAPPPVQNAAAMGADASLDARAQATLQRDAPIGNLESARTDGSSATLPDERTPWLTGAPSPTVTEKTPSAGAPPDDATYGVKTPGAVSPITTGVADAREPQPSEVVLSPSSRATAPELPTAHPPELRPKVVWRVVDSRPPDGARPWLPAAPSVTPERRNGSSVADPRAAPGSATIPAQ
ncbi:ComEC/Rec2 family competence protein [Ancylobacter sp. WKF20]|uniref:ComEC/Rec2 family competence protein n=1 Tax=Ancylobacter sp. WKF20 TaxID=3039801 RepID=UPI002434130E|nr:ComEC/Rec2 family competence protein [Ancylobacter sp. WKF20]WGD31430.1 ComEC/Rec2 family competence protein [Ancylobacter sp. WKF20]